MKRYLTFIFLLVFATSVFGQNYNVDDADVTTCSGNFYDTGGSGGQYTNNETETITFTPGTAGDMLEFTFTDFDSEAIDDLLIYDGADATAPLLADVSGHSVSVPFTVTATNPAGQLTFVWDSDGSIIYDGWEATIACVPPPPTYLMIGGGGTTNTCNGFFMDDGGISSDYTDHSNTVTETFCSDNGESIRFNFTAFETREAADNLMIYDGPNTGSPLIGTYDQSISPGIVVSSGTCLTFAWSTDGTGTKPGWESTISCIPSPPPNDLCANATALPCGTTDLPGTTNNTVEELPNNTYNSNYGVWYTFTGDGNQNLISAYADFDHEIVLFSGNNCSSLTYIDNIDSELANDTESILFSSTLGTTYYVYIAHYSTSSTTTGDFTISRACITPPANDECAGAIALTVNSDQSCAAFTSATTYGGTNSGISACVGSGADDDVWFSFTATNTTHEFTLYNISGSSTNMVLEIFSGLCGSLSSIACSDPEASTWGGFTIGQLYYVRVYTYTSTVGQIVDFDICIGTPPPPPSNDEPCGATPLLVNTGNCAYQSAVLETSTTASSGIPAPGCGSLGPDMWFTAVVPASGRLIIDTDDNGGPTDLDMAWYSAPNCSGPFTLIECDDYNSTNGAMAMICRTDAICTVPGDCEQNPTLTPGMTVYVRIWDNSGSDFGPFDICAYEPSAPGAPSTCVTASIIASLPFSESNTTCCRNNDIDATDGCASSYQDGEDFFYTYTPTINETIDITITGSLTYTGVFVTDRCPSHPSAVCVGSSTNSSGNPALCGVSLSAGTEYFIMIDTDPGPNCTPFNINIYSSVTPTCDLDYSVSSIAYAPDLNNGANIALPVDDRFSTSYIPIGFPFCFDGFQFTQLLVSSNGYVIFDPIGCASNLPSAIASPGGTSGWDIDLDFPNTTQAPRNCIMFPFQDIYPSIGGTIKYQTLGVTPNRRFVLTFFEIPYFSCTSLEFTGQLKLYETSNDIEMHIDNKEICATWNEGGAVLGLHNYNGTISVIPGGYNYSTTWTTNNDAWRFTCNCVGCIALPVELVEFTGEKLSSKTNYLKWTTATELNNDYFEVERRDEFSEDFVTLDRIDGAGNSNALLHYSFTDINAPTGAAYYRLKQVDTDGKQAYSATIVIGDIGELADINSVYPNPAKDRLNIKLNSDGSEIKISLVSMNGQEIVLEESTSLYGFNEISYDVSSIPSGMYYLRVSSIKNEIYYKEKIVIE